MFTCTNLIVRWPSLNLHIRLKSLIVAPKFWALLTGVPGQGCKESQVTADASKLLVATCNGMFLSDEMKCLIPSSSRYDHFAVLCELLPAAVPSLAVNLLATSHGYFNQSLKNKLQSSLGCSRTSSYSSTHAESIVNLNNDPYLWDKIGRCFFPGAPFFKLTYRLHAAEIEAKEFIESVTKSKGWMTDYNMRRKFSSPLRVDELMAEHPRVYHTLTTLARSAREALDDVFDSFTIAEWVEQRIYPDIQMLERLQHDSSSLKSVRTWPKRPLPPLRDLKRLGVQMPEDDVSNNNSTPQISGK